jgi:hypothetical protein
MICEVAIDEFEPLVVRRLQTTGTKKSIGTWWCYLHKVGLVFLVPGSYKAMNLTLELQFLIVFIGCIPL